jgi:hypothetical protein
MEYITRTNCCFPEEIARNTRQFTITGVQKASCVETSLKVITGMYLDHLRKATIDIFLPLSYEVQDTFLIE